MARKSQRRIAPHIIAGREVAPSSTPSTVRVVETPVSAIGPNSLSFEEQYAHVRKDLRRIVILATIIIGTMLILRFVVGL